MPIPTTEAELTELFRTLGARHPDQWARSQIAEGIPQLLRFLFLKEAWAEIQDPDDSAWIDAEIGNTNRWPKAPYAGMGVALSRCLELGVSRQDLTDISRCLRAQMIFSIGYLLSRGPRQVPTELEDVTWGLFQVDDDGKPFGPQIDALHESVLDMDPTGLEMRPRSDG
jgi:hypothetical protein